jgi:hypothetical protein
MAVLGGPAAHDLEEREVADLSRSAWSVIAPRT